MSPTYRAGDGNLGVCVDGTIYVANAFTIRRFTGDGAPLAAWGVGNIGTIAGLAVDAEGRACVAASETKQIVRHVP